MRASDSLRSPSADAMKPSGRSAWTTPWNREAGEVNAVTSYDSASFTAGQETGERISACVARLAACELVEGSRWWNRRRRGLMARALVTCAEELERSADGHSPSPSDGPEAPGSSHPGR